MCPKHVMVSHMRREAIHGWGKRNRKEGEASETDRVSMCMRGMEQATEQAMEREARRAQTVSL